VIHKLSKHNKLLKYLINSYECGWWWWWCSGSGITVHGVHIVVYGVSGIYVGGTEV